MSKNFYIHHLGENDFKMESKTFQTVWIEIGEITLHIVQNGDKVSVSAFPKGLELDDPLARLETTQTQAKENQLETACY